MPRKLKTYITNLGFFELALAAPSMKAALEAWGMGHNAFHHGFARETDDPKIVAATMAQPGVVLRRPVGTKGAFTENAALPKQLWKIEPSSKSAKPEARAQPAPARTSKTVERKKEKADPAAIISFEKERARREREREQKEAREAATQERERAQTKRAVDKVEAALARAQERHDKAMDAIERERERLDRLAEFENDKWKSARDELNAALRRAKKQ